jgi:hypothetical protein
LDPNIELLPEAAATVGSPEDQFLKKYNVGFADNEDRFKLLKDKKDRVYFDRNNAGGIKMIEELRN